MKKFLDDQEGQAVVEYILMISMALSLVVIMGTGFRRSIFRLWTFYTKMIAAPYPGAPFTPGGGGSG